MTPCLTATSKVLISLINHIIQSRIFRQFSVKDAGHKLPGRYPPEQIIRHNPVGHLTVQKVHTLLNQVQCEEPGLQEGLDPVIYNLDQPFRADLFRNTFPDLVGEIIQVDGGLALR